MTACRCPHCGHVFKPGEAKTTPAPASAADWLERLLETCRDRKIPLTWDNRVSEKQAAEFVGREVATLQNWSYSDQRLPFVKVGNRRTYRLEDIAAYLARGEK